MRISEVRRIMATQTLPERLQEVMKLRKFDQAALASWLKVDPSTVSRWLVGSSLPRPKSREAFARALGVKAEWLFNGVGEMQDALDDDDMAPVPATNRASLDDVRCLLLRMAHELRTLAQMPFPPPEPLRALALQAEMLSKMEF